MNNILDKVIEASTNRRYADALGLITTALVQDPTNRDLLCERALCSMYFSSEAEAIQLLPKLEGAKRYDLLCELLGDFLTCTLQLDPTNAEAAVALGRISSHYNSSGRHVGTKLTACLITKNEEENLDRCLSSLKGVVDEIVVVDTGSTDRTVRIAKKYGAIIGSFEWCDNFAAARNEALKLATGNWALWIDADEELTPESAAAIKHGIARPQFGGYDIEILNFTDEREGGNEFRHWPTRLFRLLPGVQFTGRIHEQITPSLANLGMQWVRLDGAQLLHYGYRPSVMEARGKIERTVRILEKEVRESPRDPFHWFNMANTYFVAHRFPEAENAALTCINLMAPDADYGRLAYQIVAVSAGNQNKFDHALKACDEADAKGFGGIINEFERAQIYLKAGRHNEALLAAEKCMKCDWPTGMTGDRGIFTHKRLVVLGQIYAVLGRYKDALKALDQALEIDPNMPSALYSKGAILEKMGREEESLSYFRRAVIDPESAALANKGVGRISLHMQKFRDAVQAFQSAWEAATDDYDAWVGWVNACEAQGDMAGLLSAYDAFAKVHEPTAEILINWGRTLESAGDAERALQCFTEAIKREPECANAYFNCGDLLYRLGLPQDSAHLYQTGLKYDPLNADAWFTLGNSLAMSGLNEGAIKSYNQAIALNPAHERARHNIKIVQSEQIAAA